MARVPLASVYPLVTTRVLARPFTYEVAEGVGKGAVVSMPLGRSKVRGVVVNKVTGKPFKERVFFQASAESQAAPKVSF